MLIRRFAPVVMSVWFATTLLSGYAYADNTPPEKASSGAQTDKLVVYAAGYRTDSANTDHPGYWKNGKWIKLAPYFGHINSVAVKRGNVFAAGSGFNQKGGGGIWKDGKWTALAGSVSVNSMDVTPSATYVTGDTIDVNSSVPIVTGYWRNGSWHRLQNGSRTVAIEALHQDLYIAGYAYKGSDIWVGFWKNGVWHGVVPGLFADVTSMAVSGSDVYLGGQAGSDTFYLHAGYWKDGKWVLLPSLDRSKQSEVNCLVVTAHAVYAGGYSYNNTGMVPGYWKNGVWVELSRPNPKRNGSVNALAVFGNHVYAGGYRMEASGIFTPGYWEDGKWVGLSLPSGGRGGEVLSLVVTRE